MALDEEEHWSSERRTIVVLFVECRSQTSVLVDEASDLLVLLREYIAQ